MTVGTVDTGVETVSCFLGNTMRQGWWCEGGCAKRQVYVLHRRTPLRSDSWSSYYFLQ